MPSVYSTFKHFVQIAKEVTPGTAVTTGLTSIPITKAEFQDKPHFLDDKSLTGSMSTLYGRQQGTIPTDISFEGNAYPDTLVHLLSNLLGDRTSTTGSGSATTTTAASTAGATTISLTASIPAGNVVQIETAGNVAECATIVSVTGAGPYVATIFPALDYAHASGVAVTPLNRHVTSLLNSGQGQPVTHTLVDSFGPGVNGGRIYPGACLADLDFAFNAANGLFHYKAKAMSWPSQDSPVALTPNPSGLGAMPAWQAIVGIGGTSSASPNATVMSLDVNVKRKLEADYTLQGSQNPASITRGAIDVHGKMTVLAPDDSQYQLMRRNAQPQMQVVLATGSGLVQFDIGQAAYKTAKPSLGKAAVEYSVEFDGVINTTNAGASGGRSPISISVANAVTPASY